MFLFRLIEALVNKQVFDDCIVSSFSKYQKMKQTLLVNIQEYHSDKKVKERISEAKDKLQG